MTGSSQRRREAAFRAGREDGLATAEAERNLFKGKYRSIVTLLNTTRQQLHEIFDHVDDEGDRRYFGSTNHVDWLRDLLDCMDGWSIDAMLSKGDINKMEADPYAEIRALRARAEAAEAELDSRTRALDEAETELNHLCAGIKRLSDEEELCAETTGDDPFSMIYLAAKLAAAEKAGADQSAMSSKLLEISQRLIKWDTDFPVNCWNGYAGLNELDKIIADAKLAVHHAGASYDDEFGENSPPAKEGGANGR
jgi:hypothetical protein